MSSTKFKEQGEDEEEEEEEEEAEEEEEFGPNIRTYLKIIRDSSKTAYDVLPSGESLGSFANRHAVERYIKKVENKRERARETRRKKRNVKEDVISSFKKPKLS